VFPLVDTLVDLILPVSPIIKQAQTVSLFADTLPAWTGHTDEQISVFSGKIRSFFSLAGTPLIFRPKWPSGLRQVPGLAADRPIFALFQSPPKCTVFSRLKQVFSGKNDLEEEFCRALAPFPLPKISGIPAIRFSVGE
jgi:hypothetical protein